MNLLAKKFNPLSHVLVPKHEVLSETEKKDFLEKNNFSIDQLPQISIKDPAIKNLKIKKDDIIKITRGTSAHNYYRRVVE